MTAKEILQVYISEARVRMHGACTRAAERLGIPAWRLRRYLHGTPEWEATQRGLTEFHRQSTWKPVLSPQRGENLEQPMLSTHDHAVDGYRCTLPNADEVVIRKHEYTCGSVRDEWWLIKWPVIVEHPLLHTQWYHEVGKLKDARALIAEYVRNEYTIPNGAFLI